MGPIAEFLGELYSIGVAMGAGDAVATIIWRSREGSNWDLVTSTGAGIEAGRQVWGIAATNSRLVAIANGFAAYTGEVWSSADGKTWSQSTMTDAAAGAASELQFNDIAFDGTSLAIVGETYSHVGEAWLSPNGDTWSPVSVEPASALKAVAPASGLGLVAVGVSGKAPAAWRSPVGDAWAALGGLRGEPQEDAHAVIRTADAYVALGSSANGTIVWTSPDALEWNRQPEELPGLADAYVGLIGSDLVATDGTTLITFLTDRNQKPFIWAATVH
jgi:hypothetical protein